MDRAGSSGVGNFLARSWFQKRYPQWRPPIPKEPKTLDDLFHDFLRDIYFAEKKILTALPKMANAAQSEDLVAAFEEHQQETEGQVERLERVFALIDETPRGKNCPAILGLLEEGKEVMEDYKVFSRAGRRSSVRSPVRRALRNLPLRHIDRLGQ